VEEAKENIRIALNVLENFIDSISGTNPRSAIIW
jgi:hypothetical protein